VKFAHGPFMEKPASVSFAEPGPIEPRILYRVPTAPGSGGAPVFSSDWELVGIHEGLFSFEQRDVKRGISMTLIIERLRGRGIVLTEQGPQHHSVQLE